MRVQDLRDFAINTGKLYEGHCAMARLPASDTHWVNYVRRTVLPLYRTEFREPHEGMSLDDIAQVAFELKVYYTQHIAESDEQ
jgi:hypothetical protein